MFINDAVCEAAATPLGEEQLRVGEPLETELGLATIDKTVQQDFSCVNGFLYATSFVSVHGSADAYE